MKWIKRPEPTKPCDLKPMHWEQELRARYIRYIRNYLAAILIVALLIVLSGCSKTVSVQPMPTPPANLEAPCPALPMPPQPLLDPARVIWEIEIITAYGDCSARHRLAMAAWRDAIEE